MNGAKTGGGLFLVAAGLIAALYGVDGADFYQFLTSCISRSACGAWSYWGLTSLGISIGAFIVAGLVVFVLGALLVWKGASAPSDSEWKVRELEARLKKLEAEKR